MKLREFKFNSIMQPGLCIMEERKSFVERGKSYEGFIGDVLRAIPIEWADREIKETRVYFDIFVIELKGND